MHDVVGPRSDILTLPTPLMREAMARAEVGDDVWEEDPTVRRLEELAARRTGKEAALFMSSGTQGNLVSVLTQTRPGQEIRCVTHKDIDGDGDARALEAFREITAAW